MTSAQWVAWLSTPGFAGVCASAAALVGGVLAAWRWSREQRFNREQEERQHAADLDNEKQKRWWQQRDWLWNNGGSLPDEQLLDALDVLETQASTSQQRVFLVVVAEALLKQKRKRRWR